MHLAYHTYMFVFAGLCGLQVLSEGVYRGRASQIRDEEVHANLPLHTKVDQDRGHGEFSFVMLAKGSGSEPADRNQDVPLYHRLSPGQGQGEAKHLETDEVRLMQRGRDKRKRSPSPRRRRQKPQTRDSVDREDRGRDRQDGCDDEEWEWDEDARRSFRRQWRSRERTSTSSWARLPPWATRRSEPATSSGQRPEARARPAKAPPATPPSAPATRSLTRAKHVSIVPTLEQLGPGVRMWSDAIGITRESENFTGQDRHLLSNSTVFGLARDLACMTHGQRVNAYCDLIRFLGVLYADLMRTMLRAEELADEEVLLQVTKVDAIPSMAPYLRRKETNAAAATTTCKRRDVRGEGQTTNLSGMVGKAIEIEAMGEGFEIDEPDQGEYVDVEVEAGDFEEELHDQGSPPKTHQATEQGEDEEERLEPEGLEAGYDEGMDANPEAEGLGDQGAGEQGYHRDTHLEEASDDYGENHEDMEIDIDESDIVDVDD